MPIVALAHELKRIKPDVYIVYIGETNGKYAEMTASNPDIDEIKTVLAGKFRRYHGESWLRRVFDIQTNLLNLRDMFYFLIGTLQALVLMERLSPDAVLLKGGFVGVPTGLAAAFWRIPFVTHDSDALPGLANRIVARWAKYHATGMPADNYGYPKESIRHVGVLVSDRYQPVSAQQQATFKKELNLPPKAKLLLVTGGSGGAGSINLAVKNILPQLMQDYEDLYVVHQVGKGKAGVYEGYLHPRLQITELLTPMYVYTGASDLIVARAGANSLAEFGVQGRACIIIPNPLLTGGHQMKNVEPLEKRGAIRVVNETTLKKNPENLDGAIRSLLRSDSERQKLGKNLQSMTIPDAASKLAVVLLEVAGT